MENIELFTLQQEVKLFYEEVEMKLNRTVYYEIFYSKFSTNADILFIGINPGGNENQMTTAIDSFEYLDYDYVLARETKQVFSDAGYPKLLENLNKENKVVKTNLYYVSTIGLKEFNIFLDELKAKNLLEKFYQLSQKWTSKIIELSNPKIIIYEGKMAYDESPPFLNNENVVKSIELEDAYFYKYENIPYGMIYYKRNRSMIKNKKDMAIILKNELDLLYK